MTGHEGNTRGTTAIFSHQFCYLALAVDLIIGPNHTKSDRQHLVPVCYVFDLTLQHSRKNLAKTTKSRIYLAINSSQAVAIFTSRRFTNDAISRFLIESTEVEVIKFAHPPGVSS